MKIQYAATCLFGLEALLGGEIDELGYKRILTIDGRVFFEGDETAVPRCNINFRYAERLYIVVGSFSAPDFTALFDGTKALPWEEYIHRDDAFPVKGHSIKSALFSIPDCQKIIKKAVADRLCGCYGLNFMPETATTYQIEFFILSNTAYLMLDTSGVALHKRGYRPMTLAAPLRETLAAALAAIARPRENVLFRDPFCGSGTIPIEAAMLMTHTAPGIGRFFASENYAAFPQKLWTAARDEARSLVVETDFEAYATDIDMKCVEITKDNIARAKMGKYVKTYCENALDIKTEGRRGTIVCNPPYGERMGTAESAERLYAEMGKHFKTLDSWQIYVITSCESFERLYGRRADKVRKLYNGMLKCNLYQYFRNPDYKHDKK